jgi:hypothetical protein
MNAQNRPSPAQQSLKSNLQKNGAKLKFQIAEDPENVAPIRSPALQSPIPRPLFSKQLTTGKENRDSPSRTVTCEEEVPASRPAPNTTTAQVPWSPKNSTQDTVMDTQEDTHIFTQEHTQSTQPTQYTQSFRRSVRLSENERRDTGESFVSAKEAFGSKHASKENLRNNYMHDAMDGDNDKLNNTQSDAQDTVIRHEASSIHENTTAIHHEPSGSPQQHQLVSEQYSISVETQETLDTANHRALAPEPKNPFSAYSVQPTSAEADSQHDNTIVHHDVHDQMDIDDEDVRSPSDGSSARAVYFKEEHGQSRVSY